LHPSFILITYSIVTDYQNKEIKAAYDKTITIFLLQNIYKKRNPITPGFSLYMGARSSLVVNALGYKLEGCGFETRWGETLNLPNPSRPTRPWGLLSL
jgi:hypothetical protein